MKWFALFLAFYMSALTAFPCSDGTTLSGSPKTILTAHAETDHPANVGDLCSPLCICACCSGFFVLKASPALDAEAVFASFPKYASHYQSALLAVSSNIWQPPKI